MGGTRDINLLAAEARTGVVTSPTHENINGTAAHFVVNITSLSSNQTLTLDAIGVTESGAEYRLFTSLPMNVATTYRYVLGPFVKCVPGIACRDFIPPRIKFTITPSQAAQADSYSLDLILNTA